MVRKFTDAKLFTSNDWYWLQVSFAQIHTTTYVNSSWKYLITKLFSQWYISVCHSNNIFSKSESGITIRLCNEETAVGLPDAKLKCWLLKKKRLELHMEFLTQKCTKWAEAIHLLFGGAAEEVIRIDYEYICDYKNTQQRLFFLRKLPCQLLVNHYRSTTESILCYCVTVWYTSCTAENCRDLAQTVKTVQRVVRAKLPDLDRSLQRLMLVVILSSPSVWLFTKWIHLLLISSAIESLNKVTAELFCKLSRHPVKMHK